MNGDQTPSSVQNDIRNSILRERADSLALEHADSVDEQLTGMLLFALGEEMYGVRISEVREIYNEYLVTPVPCVPEFIVGVINIRGEIVSVTDLRSIMGLGHAPAPTGDEQLPVIVVSDSTVCTALLVDSIGDIVEIAADAIEPPLAATDKAQADYISGTIYNGGKLVALVNLPRVLTPIVSG